MMNPEPRLPFSRARRSPARARDSQRPTPLRDFAAGVVQFARAALSEPHTLKIERREIFLPRLPRELDRFRIVQLTDIHHSPLTSRATIERAVAVANDLRPDMIALTGDYVSHEREYAAPAAEMLGRLCSRYGTFAVLGNHDHWTDAALVTDLLELEGIRVLTNAGMRFEATEHDCASFWLAGVDDTMVGLEDVPLALAGAKANEMKLLLAHNPTVLRRAARHDVDFILAGHTHGGQVTLRPEISRSGRPRRRLLRGLGRQGDTQIYVSRGLGCVVLPVRYGCPPEVTLLELRTL